MPVPRPTRLGVAALAGALLLPLTGTAFTAATAVDDIVHPGKLASWSFTTEGIKVVATSPDVARIEYRRVLSAGAATPWTTYTAPLQPQAHDVPGHQEYRTVAKDGSVSEPVKVPGEQAVDFTTSVRGGTYGTPTRVTFDVEDVAALGTLPPATAKVIVAVNDVERVWTTKVKNGRAVVTLPAGLPAGTVRLNMGVDVEHPYVYSAWWAHSAKHNIAKARTSAKVTLVRKRGAVSSVRATVKMPGVVLSRKIDQASADGKVRLTFTRGGTKVATARGFVSAKGVVTVKVPKKVRTAGRYTVKANYVGSSNLKRSASKKVTFRVR